MFQAAWEGLLEIGGDVGTSLLDAFVEVEKEKARQPETLKSQEPIKGKKVDGSTVVAQPKVQPPVPQNMFTPKNMMIAGGALLGVVALVLLTRK